jgi:uroporphyrinogen decarboxylase
MSQYPLFEKRKVFIMNSREKFNAIMSFDNNSPNMKAEFGYWAGTIRSWFDQGLPRLQSIPENVLDGELIRGALPLYPESNELVDMNVLPYLKLDSYLAKFPFDISPRLGSKILKEDEKEKIFNDNYGLTNRASKECAGIPMVLDYPIKNSKDFNDYKNYYDSSFSARLPENWNDLVKSLKHRSFPIRLGGNPFGFSFLARHLMGEVVYMTKLFDDPGLIKDINRFYLDYVKKYWSLILKDIEIDCIFILEDMAYRSGSFISREMFREFLSPYYIEFIDFLKQYNVKNIVVDCDGLIDELIPLWIEVGVNGIFPIEAVNDLVEIRQLYPELKLLGGFDKKTLFKGSSREEIDREITKVVSVTEKGGYIPHIDHAVSADVTWDNFKYYRFKLNEILDK